MSIEKVWVRSGANPYLLADEINQAIAEAQAEGRIVLDIRYTATTVSEESDWFTAVLLLGVA